MPPEFHKIQGMWRTEEDMQLMGDSAARGLGSCVGAFFFPLLGGIVLPEEKLSKIQSEDSEMIIE